MTIAHRAADIPLTQASPHPSTPSPPHPNSRSVSSSARSVPSVVNPASDREIINELLSPGIDIDAILDEHHITIHQLAALTEHPIAQRAVQALETVAAFRARAWAARNRDRATHILECVAFNPDAPPETARKAAAALIRIAHAKSHETRDTPRAAPPPNPRRHATPQSRPDRPDNPAPAPGKPPRSNLVSPGPHRESHRMVRAERRPNSHLLPPPSPTPFRPFPGTSGPSAPSFSDLAAQSRPPPMRQVHMPPLPQFDSPSYSRIPGMLKFDLTLR